MDRRNALPDRLKTLLHVCMNDWRYHRQWWYWSGEARLRVEGKDIKPTSTGEAGRGKADAAAHDFRDEIARISDLRARVVSIIKNCNENMRKAGRPCRRGKV